MMTLSLLLKAAPEVVFTLLFPCDSLALIMGMLKSILSIRGPLS